MTDRDDIRLNGVSKSFGPTQALADVSFQIERGHIHALLGGNGSGKSTLIKILAGVQAADEGSMEIGTDRFDLRLQTPSLAAGAGIRFVHQQRSTFPDLTIAENLAIGHGFITGPGDRIRWKATRQHARDVMKRFGIDAHPDQDLSEVSPATQTMVAIARALQDLDGASRGLLVLDEPTASLPAAEVELLLSSLRHYADEGQTILYVTHRLEEVFALADRATLLRDGRLVDTVSPSELNTDRLVELMMGQTVDSVQRVSSDSKGPEILVLEDVGGGAVEEVDLSARSGEVIGVAGLIGSGRSSLLKILFGAVALESGQVTLDGQVRHLGSPQKAMEAGFAYVPEDRATDAAFYELSVEENLSITVLGDYFRGGAIRGRDELRDSRKLIGAYGIVAEDERSLLSSLSGGNQQKVILARWLRRKPRVLLLDEPTQGVDVRARAEIYGLVHRAVDEGSTALVASSDFEELAVICDRVMVLRKGRVHGWVDGPDLTSERIHQMAHGAVAV